MHRIVETQEKPAIPTADLIENLLSVVAAMVRGSELDQHERDRIQRSLAETMDAVCRGAATPQQEQDDQLMHHVPTVAEARASADE